MPRSPYSCFCFFSSLTFSCVPSLTHIFAAPRAHTHTRTPRAGFSKDRQNWFQFLKCSKLLSLRLIRMELIFSFFRFFSSVIEFPSFSAGANCLRNEFNHLKFALIWPVYKLRSCAQSHGAHKHTRHGPEMWQRRYRPHRTVKYILIHFHRTPSVHTFVRSVNRR